LRFKGPTAIKRYNFIAHGLGRLITLPLSIDAEVKARQVNARFLCNATARPSYRATLGLLAIRAPAVILCDDEPDRLLCVENLQSIYCD
jgi:hypothetical protein